MKDRLAEATPRRENLGMDSGWVYRFSQIKKLKASIRYGRYHNLTDPDVPTLPPHVSIKQAQSYATAILKGNPDTRGILWHTFKRS